MHFGRDCIQDIPECRSPYDISQSYNLVLQAGFYNQ